MISDLSKFEMVKVTDGSTVHEMIKANAAPVDNGQMIL
jgi:hypothetical protein